MAVPVVGNKNARTYGFLTVLGIYLITLIGLIWIFSVNRNTKIVDEEKSQVNTSSIQAELDSLKLMVEGFGFIADLNQQLLELEKDSTTQIIEGPRVSRKLLDEKGVYFNLEYPLSIQRYDTILTKAYEQLESGRKEIRQNQIKYEMAKMTSINTFDEEKDNLQSEVDRLTQELSTCNQLRELAMGQIGGATNSSQGEIQTLQKQLQECNGRLGELEGKINRLKGSLEQVGALLDEKVLERRGLFKSKEDREFIKLINQKVGEIRGSLN